MKPAAVLILTYNEERHIGRALQSVVPFASETFVIDSFSNDRTVEIAREYGATVLQNPFVHQAQQFQWGLDNAPITADWVLRLDADEIIEPDLAERIARELPGLPGDVTGVNIDRKHIFMGRWIRHGGRYPLTLLRLFRRGHGRIEQRWMDEHIIVETGRTVHFPGGFSDHNLYDLTFFTDKHNKYATREAIDVINQRQGLFERDVDVTAEAASKQAAFKRFVKEKIYNKIPFQFSTLGYFLFRYIVQLGFLDGREGLIYHFLQGYWYRFLVGAKIIELEAAIEGLTSPEEKRAELARLTGLKL